MGLDTLTPDDPIFRDEDALRDHFPDRILERDEKLAEYQSKFKEVVRNKRPRNVFVYGPTGVGKTIGTQAVLESIEDSIEQFDYADSDFEKPSLKTVHLECKDLNTSYQVAANLVNVLRADTDRSKISTTGYPEGDIYEMLFSELETIDDSHVLIALDEIDNIGDDDNILYKLPRCNNDNSANHVPPEETKVGVVGITNDGSFKDYLDPRVKSTLCNREVHFPPYDAKELKTILRDRAKVAFHDDVLEEDVIPLTAAFSAQRKGYARTALDLLYETADIARANGREQITEAHVREAEEIIQQGAIVKEVEGLSTHGELVTYTLIRLEEDGEAPAKLDIVYAWYETFANEIDVDTVTPRTVHDVLNDLMMNGIATSHEINQGRAGGRHYEYELGVQKDPILSGLQSDTRLKEISSEERF